MAMSKKRAGANGGAGGGDSYDVGYRKPQKAGQFKKGQSGNPGGRRKGSQNISSVLEEVLGQEIEIVESQKKHTVTIEKAVILRWVQEGLKGNSVRSKASTIANSALNWPTSLPSRITTPRTTRCSRTISKRKSMQRSRRSNAIGRTQQRS